MSDDALRAARERAANIDPAAAAVAIGADYSGDEGGGNGDGAAGGRFSVRFLGSDVTISYPGFVVTPSAWGMPPHVMALLIYHLAICDGTPPSGEWVSFGDLPSGDFYVSAFRGYTGRVLAERFEADPNALGSAMLALGAKELPGYADRAWTIDALPRVPVAVLWWNADDEFSARADLLFDSTALHHLPLDGCAVLGSWLTALLVSD